MQPNIQAHKVFLAIYVPMIMMFERFHQLKLCKVMSVTSHHVRIQATEEITIKFCWSSPLGRTSKSGFLVARGHCTLLHGTL